MIIILIIICITLSSCAETKTLESDPLVEVLGANYTEMDKINYVYNLVSDLRALSTYSANLLLNDARVFGISSLTSKFIRESYDLHNGNWQQAILNADLYIEYVEEQANEYFNNLDCHYQDIDKSIDVEILIGKEKKLLDLNIELIEIYKETYVINATSSWAEYLTILYDRYYPDEERILSEMERLGYDEDTRKIADISVQIADKSNEMSGLITDIGNFAKFAMLDIVDNLKMMGFNSEELLNSGDDYETFLEVLSKMNSFDVELILEEYGLAKNNRIEDYAKNENTDEFPTTKSSEKILEGKKNQELSQDSLPLTKTVTSVIEIYENEHELELFISKLGYYIYKRPYDFVIKEFERHDEYSLDNSNLAIEVGFSIFLMDDTIEGVKKQVMEDLNKRFVNVSEQQFVESPIEGVLVESFGEYVELFDCYEYPMEKHYITEKNGSVFHIKVVMEDFLEGTEDIIEMTLKEFNIM